MGKRKECIECNNGDHPYTTEADHQLTGIFQEYEGGKKIPFRKNVCHDHLICLLDDNSHNSDTWNIKNLKGHHYYNETFRRK